MHVPPGMRSTGLQAGATVKNDHHVLAQILGLRFLALFQTFASRDHQDDRHDPQAIPNMVRNARSL